ncbi:MAG: hypothetical protein KDA85_11905, partial [Planctomycetaceae bacterium]|nr:hypothetical protein [Planctomycetaceae bacterium]
MALPCSFPEVMSPVRRVLIFIILITSTGIAGEAPGGDAEFTSLRVQPESLVLSSPEATDRILVWGVTAGGELRDVTHLASFQPTQSDIVAVHSEGTVVPIRDGIVEIEIRAADLEARCRAEVRDVTVPLPVSFAGQVIPVLSKAGCNAGSCHGKAEGQNGFRLSVFGYDSVADHQAIVMEGRGRRVFPAAPAHSLLLRKAIGTSPHGGGRRIEADSRWYRLLERWITEGAGRNQIVEERRVNHIEVQPAEITLLPRSQQRLRVVAVRSDGVQTGVTAECDFQSNHTPVAEVDHDGLVTATEVPGEAGILVRYRGHVAVCRINRPLPNSEFEPRENLSELD